MGPQNRHFFTILRLHLKLFSFFFILFMPQNSELLKLN